MVGEEAEVWSARRCGCGRGALAVVEQGAARGRLGAGQSLLRRAEAMIFGHLVHLRRIDGLLRVVRNGGCGSQRAFLFRRSRDRSSWLAQTEVAAGAWSGDTAIALLACGRVNGARVVFIFEILHTFDCVLFCAGEERRGFAELGAGLQSAPREVL